MDAPELFALPPEQFTAARDAAAKTARAAGDRELAAALKALRRPAPAAYVVNLLTARQRSVLDGLLDLGPALAAAQAGGDAAQLRRLGEKRRQLVESVADLALAAASVPTGSTLRAEVVGTLEAAVADPATADAVRSGRLTRALSYAGFGRIELEGAVAPEPHQDSGGAGTTGQRVPSRLAGGSPRYQRTVPDRPMGSPTPTEPSVDRPASPPPGAAGRRAEQQQQKRQERLRQKRVTELEQEALAAAGELDDAVSAADRAAAALSRACAVAHETAARVDELRLALEQAERDAEAAAQAEVAASCKADDALRRVGTAQDRAASARAALDEVRRGGAAPVSGLR